MEEEIKKGDNGYIKVHDSGHNQLKMLNSEETHQVSFIVTEYMPGGTFLNLIVKHQQIFQDEKLVRYYFRQIVETLIR